MRHLGIIMDGNRRWAKERGLPGFLGHKAGAEKAKQVVRWCADREIKFLTLFVFSAENWQRSKREINFLMKFAGNFADANIKELHEAGGRIKVLGSREGLSASLMNKIEKAEGLTKNNGKITIGLAFNYGGRAEIIKAIRRIIEDKVHSGDVTEELVGNYLYTAGFPDPDLIIRTSGEKRTSGFLLWQSAYSELYFTEKYWPDFSEKDLDDALAEYSERQRRFGK